MYDGSASIDSFMNSYNLVKGYAINRFSDEYIFEHKGALTHTQASEIYKYFATNKDSAQQKAIDDLKLKHQKSPFEFGKVDDSVIDYNNTNAEGKVNWKDLNDNQKNAIVIVGTIAQQSGLDVELIIDGYERGINGAFEISGNKILIDVYAGMDKVVGSKWDNLILPTLSHEMTHWMKDKSPVLYRKYESYVFETLMQGGKTETQILDERRRKLEKAHPGVNYTDAQVRDEVVARASEDMLGKSEVIKGFVDSLSNEEKKTFVDKVKEFLRNIKEWFNSYLSKVKSSAPEAKSIREATNRIDEQIKMWDEMLKSSIETNQALKNEGVNIADIIGKDVSSHDIQFNERLIEKHKDMLSNNYSEDAAIDLESLMARYEKVIDIWKTLGGELNSKFLKEWNEKVGTDRTFSIFKAQAGYKYNVELSSMCKKGIPLFEAIDTIVKEEVMRQLNTQSFGKAEKEILYDILKKHNFEMFF
jgi:DNA-binding ferritin-like protein (Dps family)